VKASRQPGEGKTVAVYLTALPRDSRTALENLRRSIRAAAPGAVELIAWGMPAFKLGKLLVGYAGFKNHCSFFPMSVAVMHRYAAELRGYDTTKGSIHFSLAKPLPAALVKRMVKARIVETEAGQPLRRPSRRESPNKIPRRLD
jgi:uncharacterized protein YdhG (YjbR/CyaY superfamily)